MHHYEFWIFPADFVEILDEISVTLVEMEDYREAQPISRFTLLCWEKIFGLNHPDLYSPLLRLVNIEEKLGRTEEAEALRTKCAAVVDKTSGLDLASFVATHDSDARFYDGNGRYNGERSLAERALATNERLHGRKHPDIALQLENVAKYHAEIYVRPTKEAAQFCKRAIKIRENIQGPDHIEVAKSLDNLGDIYARLSEHRSKSVPLYERALSIREKLLGTRHPNVATSLIKIAKNKYGNLPTTVDGERHESEQYPPLRRALAIREETLGPEHPATAEVREEIAYLAELHDEKIDENAVYERGLKVREQALGLEHPDVWVALNYLVDAHNEEGRYEESRELLLRMLEFQERILGRDHPDIATTLEKLAEIAVEHDTAENAVELYKRALSIREALPPSEQFNHFSNHNIKDTLSGLANVYQREERFDEAEVVYLRLMSALDARLPWTESELGEVLERLTNLYFEQERWDAAEPLYERLLEVWKNTHWMGGAPESVPKGLANLARVYQAKEKLSAAENLYQQALGVWEKRQNIGEMSYRKDIAEILVSLFDSQGRDAEADPLTDEALALLRRAPEEERVGIMICLQNYATLLSLTDRQKEASMLERLASDLGDIGKVG